MKQIKLFAGFVIVLLLYTYESKAQIYIQDVNGSPIRAKRYLDVNGSPYLVDKWEKGVVQLANKQTYNLDIKYDEIADKIFFRNKNGDSLDFVEQVKEFKIDYILNDKFESHLFRNGFPSTSPKTNNNSFYEILYDGGTKLLKKTTKLLWEETTTYGNANITKNITDKTLYFIVQSDKIIPLKKDRKSVVGALSNKSAELEKYIKDNKLDVRQDIDLIRVFTYYNSLN